MKALRIPSAVFALVTSLGVSAFSQDAYEGGRGLISLEGPTGMFLSPTSGTLPGGTATGQYCIFFPNNKTDVIGHGGLGEYAVTDDFNAGVQVSFIQRDVGNGDDFFAIGPNARYRLTKDEEGGMPQTAVGAYSRFGDEEIQFFAGYAAAYKRFALGGQDSAVRSLGVHGGVRAKAVENDNLDDEVAGYIGGELQLPARIYLVGEVTTEHDNANDLPYSFGVQWRAGGINMSFAGIDTGGVDEPSFYWGIGGAF